MASIGAKGAVSGVAALAVGVELVVELLLASLEEGSRPQAVRDGPVGTGLPVSRWCGTSRRRAGPGAAPGLVRAAVAVVLDRLRVCPFGDAEVVELGERGAQLGSGVLGLLDQAG